MGHNLFYPTGLLLGDLMLRQNLDLSYSYGNNETSNKYCLNPISQL
uniref:Uncharacterized protein n=1 Tax=Methylophaga nitratireducenticrescens TaxID=754476 RepID=I1XFV3_METNJ